ncbi:MAG: GYF domain-containing protein [Bacillota bacterium]
MTDYRTSLYTIRREGQEFGPFTGEEIKDMLKTSTITLDDEISTQNLHAWQKIKYSNIFYDYLKN